ncbi:hypothetical protein AX17_000896 [Amanita inopinata Kibby_2008]|nr:hypothetical protein AX17_000896 [Amanita inopinata Kibby_2008]
MLGARTKRINSYGKRGHCIVSVSDERPTRKEIPNIFDEPDTQIQWAPIASRMRRREDVHTSFPSKSTPSRVIHVQRKKPILSPLRKKKPAIGSRDARATETSSNHVIVEGRDNKFDDTLHTSGTGELTRTPLSAYSLNVASSPLAAKKGKRAVSKAAPSKLHRPSSQVIDVDIIVIDGSGKTITKERRISRNIVMNSRKPNVASHSHGAEQSTQNASEDSETELADRNRRRGRLRKHAIVRSICSDKESEVELNVSPSTGESTSPSATINEPEIRFPTEPNEVRSIQRETSTPPVSHSESKGGIIPASLGLNDARPRLLEQRRKLNNKSLVCTHHYHHIPSPIAPRRQLTPIRAVRSSRNMVVPPSPPTPTDFDTSIDLSDFDVDSSAFLDASSNSSDPAIPNYLKPLLQECHQETCGLYEFSAFIKSFPYDPIIRSSLTDHSSTSLGFKKIGEASYSEVFGIGDVVLKIIPLRDESSEHNDLSNQKPGGGARREADGMEGPASSDAKDVRKEIIVTRAMGEVCDGFVKLLKAYIVRGKYPELLLRLWDDYNEQRGSESIRPDTFTASQVYAIIVLPNGGPDLEAYTFTNAGKTGWRQSCSLFWQVCKSLAHAEQLVSFEHRDLHWGQILVNDLPVAFAASLGKSGTEGTRERLYMDESAHGVQATIIDLGLSRMDATDGNGAEKIYWTALDEEIFMGEGDYQFNVYRIMRDHIADDWESFNPVTNVMWLHYLVLKLVHSKRLKPPSSRAAQSARSMYTERECYNCLVEMENMLADCIANLSHGKKVTKTTKGRARRKTQAPVQLERRVLARSTCAGDVVQYGVTKGWIMPIA